MEKFGPRMTFRNIYCMLFTNIMVIKLTILSKKTKLSTKNLNYTISFKLIRDRFMNNANFTKFEVYY